MTDLTEVQRLFDEAKIHLSKAEEADKKGAKWTGEAKTALALIKKAIAIMERQAK